MGIGLVPPLLDPERYERILAVSEPATFAMARRPAAEEGLFAGTSTGMNVVGAITPATEIGPGHSVVTIACDTGLEYLSGDLYDPVPPA